MKDEQLEQILYEILNEEQEVPLYLTSLANLAKPKQTLQIYIQILFILSCVMIVVEEIVLYQLYLIRPEWFFVAVAIFITTLAGIPIILYLFKSEIFNYLENQRRRNG